MTKLKDYIDEIKEESSEPRSPADKAEIDHKNSQILAAIMKIEICQMYKAYHENHRTVSELRNQKLAELQGEVDQVAEEILKGIQRENKSISDTAITECEKAIRESTDDVVRSKQILKRLKEAKRRFK